MDAEREARSGSLQCPPTGDCTCRIFHQSQAPCQGTGLGYPATSQPRRTAAQHRMGRKRRILDWSRRCARKRACRRGAPLAAVRASSGTVQSEPGAPAATTPAVAASGPKNQLNRGEQKRHLSAHGFFPAGGTASGRIKDNSPHGWIVRADGADPAHSVAGIIGYLKISGRRSACYVARAYRRRDQRDPCTLPRVVHSASRMGMQDFSGHDCSVFKVIAQHDFGSVAHVAERQRVLAERVKFAHLQRITDFSMTPHLRGHRNRD